MTRARAAALASSRLRAGDLLRVGTIGLRSRRLRTVLTALGIAIGIAAMVAVVGISSSSRADLLAELDSLGTDMLRVAPGRTAFGESTTLPESARATAERIGPVTQSAGITATSATVRRTDYIDDAVTGGILVAAADVNLLDAVSGELADGRFLDAASSELPTVVLGADAARRLGITDVGDGVRVWLGDEWFVVIGILEPAPLAPDLDSAALIGYPVAAELFDTTTSPSTLYVRTLPDQVEDVRAVLARSVDSESPDEVDVSRPSDALEARAATDVALRNLLLALGAVALVVGGVGITNVMVISVLERRSEIGVRRLSALGASTSPPSSSPRPVCSPPWAGWPGSPSALRSLRSTPAARTGWWTSRYRRWLPAPASPSQSACSPASHRRSGPPDSTPPRPSARRDPAARATAAVRVETSSFS